MTKDELSQIARHAHVAWNKELYKASEAEVFRAWWSILSDLDAGATAAAINEMTVVERFMPTPGAIRRRTLERERGRFPTTSQAWTQVMALVRATNAGVVEPTPLHPAVAETVRRLGEEAFKLGDHHGRGTFASEYEAVRDEILSTQWAPPPTQ